MSSDFKALRQTAVLVAEDNLVAQAVAKGMLERLGFRVDIVETGAAAVDAIRGGNYKIVLMDMQLPDMDGDAVVRHVRSTASEAAQTVGHRGYCKPDRGER